MYIQIMIEANTKRGKGDTHYRLNGILCLLQRLSVVAYVDSMAIDTVQCNYSVKQLQLRVRLKHSRRFLFVFFGKTFIIYTYNKPNLKYFVLSRNHIKTMYQHIQYLVKPVVMSERKVKHKIVAIDSQLQTYCYLINTITLKFCVYSKFIPINGTVNVLFTVHQQYLLSVQ